MARPRKYNVDKLVGALKAYTESSEIPILKEFCYKYPISYDYLLIVAKREDEAGNKELYRTIKRTLDKKEAQLERLGLEGRVDKTMAIFSLKQLGWRDRVDIDTTSKGDKIGNFDTAGIAKDLHGLLYGYKNDTEGDEKAKGKKGDGSK